MKHNKFLIYCFSAVLVILALIVFLSSSDKDPAGLFSVEIRVGDTCEKVKCWANEDEDLFVFLPSYAELSDAVIQIEGETEVSIDGVTLSEGMTCDVFDEGTEYELNYTYFGKQIRNKISFLKSDKIPALYIDTQSQSMEYIHSKKGNEEPGQMRLYSADGELNYSGEIDEINGRGNSTWDYYDKKPYGIKLKNEADLLEMGSAYRWVLLANANEHSNLRNKALYDLADEIGLGYSPSSQWVDLYLNGEYAGLYLLSERNEVHTNRVDIEQNGSFLVSLENVQRLSKENHSQVWTDNNQALRVHHPISVTDEDLSRIRDTFQSIENAIMADDGIDPETGKKWTQLIDLDSWARKYVIEEVCANWDACSVSQYFYYDSDDESGKVYASPVWDYDNTMGMKANWATQPANALYGNRFHVRDGYDAVWYHYLYQKEEFYEKVVELYQNEVFAEVDSMLDEKLDEYAKQIEKSHKLNHTRWSTDGADVFDKADEIRSFMKNRLRFLDSIWIENKPYHTFRVHEAIYIDYIIFDGESAPELPVLEDTPTHNFVGWYYADTDKPFDSGDSVDHDVEIYAKWAEKRSETIKDAMKVAPIVVFAIIFGCLLIVEIKRSRKR